MEGFGFQNQGLPAPTYKQENQATEEIKEDAQILSSPVLPNIAVSQQTPVHDPMPSSDIQTSIVKDRAAGKELLMVDEFSQTLEQQVEYKSGISLRESEVEEPKASAEVMNGGAFVRENEEIEANIQPESIPSQPTQ